MRFWMIQRTRRNGADLAVHARRLVTFFRAYGTPAIIQEIERRNPGALEGIERERGVSRSRVRGVRGVRGVRVCDFKVMNSLDSFFVPNIRAYVVR